MTYGSYIFILFDYEYLIIKVFKLKSEKQNKFYIYIDNKKI